MKLRLPITLLVSLLTCTAISSVAYSDGLKLEVDPTIQTVRTQSNAEKLENEYVILYKDVDEAHMNVVELETRVEQLEDEIKSLEEDPYRTPEEDTKLKNDKEKLDEVKQELESRKENYEDLKNRADELLEKIHEIDPTYKPDIQTDEQPVEEAPSTPAQPQVVTVPVPTSSTVNATGTAQRDALRNQMFGLRDRLANLGRTQAAPAPQQEYWVQPSKDGSVPGHFVKSNAPSSASDVQYHLWVEGNGGYTDLDEQSGRGGYRLQTWGGTVGAAASLENNLTLGAAFSAQWGDLTSSGGQEWASGDLDSLYLHLFGHYQSNAWGHTLILTGTTTDATLNRSGFIDGEYFNTHGDTDGYGFGALYELTYDIPLNDAGTTLLQPLFDVSIVHTQLDAYNETGTKALHVGKQEWTTGSVALGARLSGTFGSESLGHPFFGEVRASVSQDFGDTRGKTSIAWADNLGVSNTAYGSKVGATAVQVGAGISTPLTSYSTLYANVGADFRARENSVCGAVGLRFTF
jgi:TolA-binding protein